MSLDFRLVSCDSDGQPDEPIEELPCAIAEACKGSSDLYKRIGYMPPWVSYIALNSDSAVGGGAFVGPPVRDRVYGILTRLGFKMAGTTTDDDIGEAWIWLLA